MSFLDLVKQFVNFKCPKCSYSIGLVDLKAAQSQIVAGVFVCPKCQQMLINGRQDEMLDTNRVVNGHSNDIQFISTPQGTLKFVVPWKSKISKFFLLFGLGWTGFSSIFLYPILTGKGIRVNGVHTTDTSETLPIVGLLMSIGLAIFIYGLLKAINKRHILITRTKVSFHDGPLWTPKVSSFEKEEIHNLGINRYSNGKVNGKKVYVNIVEIHLKNNKVFKLCNTQILDDAIYVRQSIQSYLGITNDKKLEKVSGD